MSTFIVPPFDEEPWPTLGPAICDLIEAKAVFGPGSLKGQRAVLDDEKRAVIYKAYEVYPKGHELAGKRRFRRVRISWRKGTAKTELGAWIVFAELHPDAEIRFDGWRKVDGVWQPAGRPVNDPYIPMLAYTKDQVEELAYGALMVVVEEGEDAHLFDVSLERIIRLGSRGQADGKAMPLAGSPSARDGARTTFQYYDEPHRLNTPTLLGAYTTMEANLPKRPLDEPWSLGTTTAGKPGGGSVAELDKEEAEAIDRGEVDEPELFYFHRQAGPGYDLKKMDQRIEAIKEASGPAGAWSDIRGIAKQWDRAGADLPYLERVWLNRWTQSALQAFNPVRWGQLAQPGFVIPDRDQVTVGVDGSRWQDTTTIVVTHLDTGWQTLFGIWVPANCAGGEVPMAEVDGSVAEVFRRWRVTRLYGDPAQGFDEALARWAGKHGPKKVLSFHTDAHNMLKTALMCRNYAGAIRGGEVTNDGDPVFAEHIGNAQKRELKMLDEEKKPFWHMTKERHDSAKKIDAAMGGALSWQARLDSLAAGELQVAKPKTVMVVGR